MSEPVRISPVRPEDREEWLGLWRGYTRFYETDVPAEVTAATFERITGPGEELHGAIARDADGTAVGLVHWLTHPATWTTTDYCYLEDLFVSPDARGGRIGEALIAHVRDWASEHGSSKVYWLTAETNATARRLYDRVAAHSGFVQYQIAL
ncbi:MAG: GNAT family N-acetyltransferase [Microbacteriaceae bacterium]|nr:GNAT family N-acetyltransferase [Microbacteriaceae bacterium]